MRTDTLKKRYLFKLMTNFVGFAISFVMMGIVPRALGARAYGDFSFLSSSFERIIGFFDIGSTAFYIKLSQRQEETELVSFYFLYMGLVSILLLLFIGMMHTTGTNDVLWPDQKMLFVFLAGFWGILTWLSQILMRMVDAYGITVFTEIIKIVQKILGVFIIVTLFFTNQLNLFHFFLYHYAILIFLCVVFVWTMFQKGYLIWRRITLSISQIRGYIIEFYEYTNPLFVFALSGLIIGIAERWMLQRFGGSVEQGFYGLSFRIGSFCFLFTRAMTPLLMRELAISFNKRDFPEMARLFRRYIPLLYALAAYFACFIAMEADTVAMLIGGKEFHGASIAIMIMAFFPIHQTYGQLSSSVFYAMGKTVLYRNIVMTFAIIGLPVSFLLLAPSKWMGVGAGATGLALKMVILQFADVNVQLYYNCRLLGLRFLHFFAHQIVCVAIFLFFTFLAKMIVVHVIDLSANILFQFIACGFLYSLFVGVFVIVCPPTVGLKRNNIDVFIRSVKNRIGFQK